MKNAFIFIALFAMAACSSNSNKAETENDSTSAANIGVTDDVAQIPRFTGTIVYKNHAEGDSQRAAIFNTYAPKEYAVSVKGKKLRIKEVGGITGLNLLVNFEDSLYYQFDNKAKTVERVVRETRDFKKIEVNKTNEREEIMGYLCTKYVVTGSPFVNVETMQELWVTDDLDFPYEQGMYLGKNGFEGILPLPVICDIGFGTILKAVSVDNDVTVTMEAYVVETETLDENFEIPDNYEIK